MKVSIIGGGGLVGSCAGFALQCGGIAKEIAILDVNENLAAGQALDLMHGTPSVADQVISSVPTSISRPATWCASRPDCDANLTSRVWI